MNALTITLVVVGIALALLVARGVYLIGRGTGVEYDARERARGSDVAGTGFTLLDRLRYGDLPIVSAIEDWLGRDTGQGERARCLDCRHTWVSGQPSAKPVCPSCGGEHTRLIDEVNTD